MNWLNILFPPKYIIVGLKRQYNALFVHSTKEYSNLKQLEKINGKQYLIDINSPTYIKGNKFFYYLDIDSGKPLQYVEGTRQLTPEELDLIVGSKLVRELTKGVSENKKEKILWIILGMVLGGLLAAIIIQNIMQSKIDKIIAEYKQITPIIPVIGSMIKCLF